MPAVAATYCSPEAYDDLISRAGAPEPDEKIRAFKAELQLARAGPGQLPGDELSGAVDYGNGSDEAFLRRQWHDLYGDQPGVGASDHRGRYCPAAGPVPGGASPVADGSG
jgi:hypothetical protein